MSLAPQIQSKTVSEARNVAISFSGKLDSGELLTGTPVVAEQSSADLTFANQAVNTAALSINNLNVPIGEAAQFKVTGGTVANSPYTIVVYCSTDATPAQTLYGTITLNVVADTE